jgi:hypothetical protein
MFSGGHGEQGIDHQSRLLWNRLLHWIAGDVQLDPCYNPLLHILLWQVLGLTPIDLLPAQTNGPIP